MTEKEFQEVSGAAESVSRYIIPVLLESSKERRPDAKPVYYNSAGDYIYIRRKWKIQDLTNLIPILGTLSILREYDIKDTAAASAVKIAEYFNGEKFKAEASYNLFLKIKRIINIEDKDGIPGLSSIEELGDLVNEVIELIDNKSLFPGALSVTSDSGSIDYEESYSEDKNRGDKGKRLGVSILAVLQSIVFPIIRLFLRK